MQFNCRYGTPDGQVVTEVREGADATGVRRELERGGLHIFEVRPRGMPLKLNFSWKRRRKLPLQEFLVFNQELAALLRAGLPLLQSLELMLERLEDPGLREVLTEIRDRVETGEEFSEAFASYGDLFPPLYPATLKAGERSGELEQVIRRFIRYLSLVIDARKRVVSALVYPAVLIALSVFMIGVLAIYVVPTFSKFYADLDAELPMITQITLAVSFWLKNNIYWLSISIITTYIGLRIWSKTPKGELFFSRQLLRLPLLGQVFRFFSLSEFCRSLSTLLAGGIPLVAAFDTSVQAVSNSYVRSRIRPANDRVREGQTFHETLNETEVFPHIAINLIKVGEATGSLDEMLNSVSDYFDDRIETRMQRLLALVEPVMLIFMGALIGVLLISIYLPMFGAFSQIGS